MPTETEWAQIARANPEKIWWTPTGHVPCVGFEDLLLSHPDMRYRLLFFLERKDRVKLR